MSNKIPNFPSSKKLELSDNDEVISFTKNFAPYSDYNFVSLYSYDTKGIIELSYLNNNLVVLFEDYITEEPVYSFLGTNLLKDTSRKLVDAAKSKNYKEELKLIPEGNFKSRSFEIPGFDVIEDPDNFDYILSVDKLAKFEGGEFQDKRNLHNRFGREHPDARKKILDLTEEKVKKDILGVFKTWVERKGKSAEEAEHEEKAINRLLSSSKFFSLLAVGIYKNDSLISFAISEIVNDNYSVFHFVKADTNFKGNFETTYHFLANELQKKGVLFINYEQHLGIENLKKSKELWRPVDYLKKYIITPAS